MKIILVFMFVVNFTSQALGGDLQFEISSFVIKKGVAKKSNGVCYIPNLSPQQLYIYDDIRSLHFADTKEIKILLLKQEKDYKSILNNGKIQSGSFADKIAGKYFSTMYNLSKNKTAFFHAVFYNILLKDQRKYLMKCL